MNSSQIKCFLSVAKTLSFTQSAKDLFLSQSTVSKNVQNLEKELGTTLLSRAHQKITLTPNGQYFYVKMKQIDMEIKNVIGNLQKDNSTNTFSIDIGYMDIPFENFYLPIFVRLINEYKNIKLHLRLIDPANDEKLIDYLYKGQLDYLIYQNDYFQNKANITFTPIFEKGLSVIVNKNDPLFYSQDISIFQLKNRKIWLWDAYESLPQIQNLEYQLKNTYKIKNITKYSDILVLSDQVQIGNGIGIIPSVLYDKNDTNLKYLPLVSNIKIYYGIACTNETANKEPFSQVIRALKKAITIAKEQW